MSQDVDIVIGDRDYVAKLHLKDQAPRRIANLDALVEVDPAGERIVADDCACVVHRHFTEKGFIFDFAAIRIDQRLAAVRKMEEVQSHRLSPYVTGRSALSVDSHRIFRQTNLCLASAAQHRPWEKRAARCFGSGIGRKLGSGPRRLREKYSVHK
jgi:hypothetical protein